MKQPFLFLVLCLFLLMGMPRLFSLDAHWSSDETLWLQRSAEFMRAVQTGKFEQMPLASHLGIPTMWLAGLRQTVGMDFTRGSQQDLALARWFIGVALWSGLVVVFFLLRRLFMFWTAMFAWTFLAINPVFLAQSRRVHTDALATLFILFTVLLFLLYCVSPKQRHYLIFSGIAFGLACLSKSYSLILLFWAPACLFLFRQRGGAWRSFLSHAFLSGLLFLNCSLLTVFALWPIFWTPIFGLRALCLLGAIFFLTVVKQQDKTFVTMTVFAVSIAVGFFALKTVSEVFSSVKWAITTGHEVEYFFLGKVVSNPGWLFYPFTLSIESTPLTIPLAVGGMVWLWKQRKENTATTQQLRITFSFLGCVLLFMLFFSLTGRKFSRYLLPILPMLDVLASIGLFYMVKWLCTRIKKPYFRRTAHVACVVFILLLTAVPVFALHPYYGTYYNLCWKVTDITQIITIDEVEGLDLAAKYLNKKSDRNQIAVQASDLGVEVLGYYLKGTVHRADENRSVDYEVVYIQDVQIGRVPQTGTLNGQLDHTITLNGIDYIWIYKVSHIPGK